MTYVWQTITDHDLGWLAGWLEGEGTFFCSVQPAAGNRKEYTRLTVRGCSVDQETVETVQRIAGGRIYGPYQYTENRQPHYQWGLSGKKPAADFMRMIRPYMGSRRQTQIDKALKNGDTA